MPTTPPLPVDLSGICLERGQEPMVQEVIEAESTRLILDTFLQKREYETNFENFKSSGAYMTL